MLFLLVIMLSLLLLLLLLFLVLMMMMMMLMIMMMMLLMMMMMMMMMMTMMACNIVNAEYFFLSSQVLQPFLEATKVLSGDKYPSMSLVLAGCEIYTGDLNATCEGFWSIPTCRGTFEADEKIFLKT